MSPKTKNILTWVLSGLLAFAFAGSGLTKLMGAEMQIQNFDSWGYPQWMRYPIGLSELAFTIGLLMPAFRKWVVYAIFGWALVAIYTHIQAAPPQYQMTAGPVVFLLFNAALYFVSTPSKQNA